MPRVKDNTATMVMKVGRYLRVSTADQKKDLQVDETAALIERCGWQLAQTYVDHGSPGRATDDLARVDWYGDETAMTSLAQAGFGFSRIL